MTDSTGNQQGHRFRKGVSGNPAGRRRGSLNKATLLAQKLVDGDAEAIVKQVIETAKKDGNSRAAGWCIERILPVKRERMVKFTLPHITRPEEAPAALDAVLAAVAAGALGVSEASELAKIIESYVRAVEATELADQLAAIKKRLDDADAKRGNVGMRVA